MFLIVLSVIAVSFNKRSAIFSFGHAVGNKISSFFSWMFETEVGKIRIRLDKNSVLDANELKNIVNIVSGKKVNKATMKQMINELESHNSIIDNVYIRKTFVNGDIDVFVKEKNIIAVVMPENCNSLLDGGCQKKLLTYDNKVIPYHKMKNEDNILEISGTVGDVNVAEIIELLKKNNFYDNVQSIYFYTSGRFDIKLNNDLIVRLPRQNWKKAINSLIKMDAEYALASEIQNIKYVDLRLPDKIFVGEN
ncbi:MAG: cell division protein FtsQ/DivIB [Rickettsiales bacterium]|nr:cell division protein FtsQ/DivIB [Rickettsiales bacterium]